MCVGTVGQLEAIKYHSPFCNIHTQVIKSQDLSKKSTRFVNVSKFHEAVFWKCPSLVTNLFSLVVGLCHMGPVLCSIWVF